ncbi:MAG: DUF285 domain-containing protein [Lactobacillus amylovorus]|jgi:surface protein|nr:DUF285 domain-containing protein [Lactobacillus amylovorus]
MFSGDYKLTSVGDLSQWKTGNVTDIGSMFNGDNALQSTGNISGWNVSNVTNMDNIFNSTWALNENISGWKNNKASEKGMFNNSAVTVNVFDFNNDGLSSYLSNRKSATSIDVDVFKTTRVTNMKGLFQNFTIWNKLLA